MSVERATFTVLEVAEILGVNKNAAYALTKRRGFPAIRIGNRWVIPKQAFFRWLEQVATQGMGEDQ